MWHSNDYSMFSTQFLTVTIMMSMNMLALTVMNLNLLLSLINELNENEISY